MTTITTITTNQTFTLTDTMQDNAVKLAAIYDLLADKDLGDELRAEYVEMMTETVKALPADLANALQVEFAINGEAGTLAAELAAKFSN